MAATIEPPPGTTSNSARRVSAWLFTMCGLVALMVIVGGATRLTDSGLSITEWKPISGAIPPLTEAHWLEEFAKYQKTTEYALVNHAMSLGDFKEIYWWEWGHRFLGRFIGIAFALPLIFFVATRSVSRSLALKLSGLFLLGGAQGLLGWWMVQSGLTERVDVSQYRLAAHLALAILLFGLMFWLALDVLRPRLGAKHRLFPWALALAGAVYAQMILGAFVAGLRAGRTYNTWPLMDGEFFPDAYFSSSPQFNDLFETIAAVQFNHRLGAYLVAVGAFAFFLAAKRSHETANYGRLVAFATLSQFGLGVWTLLSATPLSLGLLHQAGALCVLAATLFAAHGLGGGSRLKSNPSSSG